MKPRAPELCPKRRANVKVLRRKDLKDIGIHYCNVHLRRLEDAGKFPRRLYLGANTCVWDEREIHEWLESKAAERGTSKRSR